MLSSGMNDFHLNDFKYNKFENKIHVDTMNPEKDMALIINEIMKQGGDIGSISIYKSSLEDVFMKLTGKSILESTMDEDG